jgi:4-amino-4-deoxy-L-arabinose transferase-like glycosyltransferase
MAVVFVAGLAAGGVDAVALAEHHIAMPLLCAVVAVMASSAMGGNDRALLLALPPMAVLAAFALPTLGRSTAAAIDWFSVFFFSIFALGIWVMYVAMQTGIPAKPAANIARLFDGFKPSFSPLALVLALLGTAAWLWLVKWRTSRNRHALWKSLVLPASGVALCWLMVMTLWLPLLDYARSYRPLIARIQTEVGSPGCIAALGLPRAQLAALEYFGRYRVDANALATTTVCEVLLQNETRHRRATTPKGWAITHKVTRPADRNDITVIYARVPSAAKP